DAADHRVPAGRPLAQAAVGRPRPARPGRAGDPGVVPLAALTSGGAGFQPAFSLAGCKPAPRHPERGEMTHILARLFAVNVAALLAPFVVATESWLRGGLRDPSDQVSYPLHLYLGLFGVMFNLGLHCLVFIYFLGTGRWVKEVALAYELPDVPLP